MINFHKIPHFFQNILTKLFKITGNTHTCLYLVPIDAAYNVVYYLWFYLKIYLNWRGQVWHGTSLVWHVIVKFDKQKSSLTFLIEFALYSTIPSLVCHKLDMINIHKNPHFFQKTLTKIFKITGNTHTCSYLVPIDAGYNVVYY